MKKQLLVLALAATGSAVHAQVKVGNNPTTINSNSILEMESTDKGMLLPRVSLLSTTDFAPLSAHVAGMTVYNTATAGDVSPGFYYNDGTKWVGLNPTENLADLRAVGTRNHITQDAGVGSDGTSAGTGVDNIAIGSETGNALTTGDRNVFVGSMSGKSNTLGFRNTGIGMNSLPANTEGAENSGIGYSTLRFNTTGTRNTAVGSYTMLSNLTGTYNTSVGNQSLYSNESGSYNTVLGNYALAGNVNGNYNIAVGNSTGTNIAGSNNIILGNSLSIQNSSSSNQLNIGNLIYGIDVDGTGTTLSTGNVGIGKKAPTNKMHVFATENPLRLEGLQAGAASDLILSVDTNGVVRKMAMGAGDLRVVGTRNHITQDAGVGSDGTSAGTGVDNIAIGSETGNALTTGDRNVFIGSTSGKATTEGVRNTGIGMNALPSNTTGTNNSGIGYSTLRFNTTGTHNTAIGAYSMLSNTSGIKNTAIGQQSLYANTTGEFNIAFGDNALYANSTGSNNIGIGKSTGNNITTGSNNIIIGNSLSIQNSTASNQLNIGNIIYASGLDGTGTTVSTGNVGIGTKTPTTRLAVVGLPVFENNTEAAALSVGDFYRTATGVVMVKY